MKDYLLQKGITLIELLVVMAIIVILTSVVFIAIDPVKRLQDAANARRSSKVSSIQIASQQYIIDQGSIPSGITATEKQFNYLDNYLLLYL